jgi:hypothetical protein
MRSTNKGFPPGVPYARDWGLPPPLTPVQLGAAADAGDATTKRPAVNNVTTERILSIFTLLVIHKKSQKSLETLNFP